MLQTLKVAKRGQVTIPSKIRKNFNLKEGSELILVKIQGKLILQPPNSNTKLSNLFGSFKLPKNQSLDTERAIKNAKKKKAVRAYGGNE